LQRFAALRRGFPSLQYGEGDGGAPTAGHVGGISAALKSDKIQ
jgi:hypothetical protein